MTLKRLKPGEPLDGAISAGTWNRFVENAERTQNLLQGNRFSTDRASVAMQVRNDSGTSLQIRQIIGFGAPPILPSDNLLAYYESPLLSARVPAEEDWEQFAVMASSAPDAGDIGTAILVGVVPCVITVSEEQHTHAIPIDGDKTKLRSSYGGYARILWKEAGTGDKHAMILLGANDQPTLRLVADEDIEHDADGEASLPDGSKTYTIHNGLDKIWDGAKLEAVWSHVLQQWIPTHARSATIIRAKSVNAIDAGDTGDIYGIVPMNGHYSPTTSTALLPTDHKGIGADVVLWAFLKQASPSYWEIFSADCNEGA